MQITSASFFIILSTVICQGETSRLKRLDQAVSKAHFEFSLDLYKSLAKSTEQDGNLIVSPYSLNLALSMLFLGTTSLTNSSSQLRSLMHFDGISYVDIHNQFKNVMENFDNNYYKTKMDIAHGIYVASDVKVAPHYNRALSQFYHSKIQHMDFRNADTSQTQGLINEYVEEVTEIKDILEKAPDVKNRLLVVDAMSLRTRWLYPFDAGDTFDKGLFFSPDNERLEVPTMSGKFRLPIGYSQAMECRVLELPFSQRRISMFILLPDDPNKGLETFENNLSTKNIQNLFSTLKDEIVNVKIPKFEMSGKFDMLKSLKALGLVDLIEKNTSDLGLMAPQDTLKLSSFTHRNNFKVSEGGSSVTKSTISTSSSTFSEKQFEVDHSFLFLVWDYYSGMLLLMGRVTNPLSG